MIKNEIMRNGKDEDGLLSDFDVYFKEKGLKTWK